MTDEAVTRILRAIQTDFAAVKRQGARLLFRTLLWCYYEIQVRDDLIEFVRNSIDAMTRKDKRQPAEGL